MTTLLYEPIGSLPPIPLEEVTAKDLIARYGVSKQTIYTRLSSIGVTGTKRGKQVFFSPVEVHQLDAAHHWLGKGYGLQDLLAAGLRKVLVTRWSICPLRRFRLLISRWS